MTTWRHAVSTTIVVALAISAGSCRRVDDAAATKELPTLSVSHWTDQTELFMEHPRLVAGSAARFAVHLTMLANFRPLDEGQASIELRSNTGPVATLQGGGPLRPGAFRVEGRVPAAGRYAWGVRVNAGALEDFHDLGTITVYPDEGAARSAPPPPEGPPAIAYLKEQQWTSDFATVVVREERVRGSMRATATVVAGAGGEAVVTAPAPGRLAATRIPHVGQRVSQGSLLARFEPRLTSVEDYALLQQQVVEARAALESAEAECRRAERLLSERAVPARRVEEATRSRTVALGRVQAAEARLAQRQETLRSGGAGTGGNSFELRSPIAGSVVMVAATPGAAYQEGVELFRIVRTNPVVVEAYLSPSMAERREDVGGLALELPGQADPVPLRVIRQWHLRVVDQRLRAVVLRFEVDNSDGRVLVGQAGNALLYTRALVLAPIVPASAILREAGRPYVFVQAGGEAFERRMVRLGPRDGDRVAVAAGLSAGERVVTRGTYEIQLASAARGLPAEGHVH
ncbi:MAG: efflux RND transporter periplasmic adaptor subunit [Acidobacteriota bacterium]